MAKVKVGDVVRLKSGGQEMTVVATWSGGKVEVVWADGYGKGIGSALIPELGLVIVEKKKTQITMDRGFQTKDR